MKQLIKNLFPVFILLSASCGVFVEVDISDEQVVLLSPSDTVTIEGPDITFQWEELDNATQYEILVVNPSFDRAQKLEVDTILGDITTFTTNLEEGNYEWSVIGKNGEYDALDAIPRSFSVTEEELDTLNIRELDIIAISPKDNSSTTDTEILFKWQEVNGAFDYVLRVYTDSNNDKIEINEILREPEYNSNTLPVGDYRWEVRARNTLDSTRLFEFTFDIKAEVVVEQ